MSGIRRIPVVPNFILIYRIDDGLRRLAESGGSGSDEGFDKRFERCDDEDSDRAANLFHQPEQSRNPVYGVLVGHQGQRQYLELA